MRKLLFFSFLAGFFIAAPLVVLYTAGYRYQFSSKNIVKTGVLSIETIPKSAEIYINDEIQQNKTQTVINNLFPGEYTVRIEKEGYLPWQKIIEIKSQDTTFLNKVILFSKKNPNLQINTEIEYISTSPSGRKIIYITTNSGLDEMWLYDTRNNSQKLLSRLPINNDSTYDIKWSANDSNIILNRETKTKSTSLINTITGKKTDLSVRFPQMKNLWWDINKDNILFIEMPENILIMNSEDESVKISHIIAKAIQISGNEYITAQNVEGMIVISRTQGEAAELIAYLPFGNYSFAKTQNDNLLMLQDKNKDRIVLIDASSKDKPILLNAIALNWQWKKNDDKLLYSDGFDLHIYDVSDHIDETITRISDPITGLAWHPEGSVVFYSQNNLISAIELDNRNGRIITKLASGSDIKDLTVGQKGEKIYFFGKMENKKGIIEKQILNK